jgi:hypothetical protein
MKIAVCFSGLIRTGINCYVNITRYLGDMLPDCDFFLHTWDYETNKPFARTHWNNIRFIQRPDEALSQEKLQKFIELYNPIRYKVDSYSEFMNSHMNDLIHYSSISEEEIYKVFRDNNENKLYGTIR